MAIKKITTQELNVMKDKSVYGLPDNPSAQNYSATQIKGAYWKPLFDVQDSLVYHINALADSVSSKLFNTITIASTQVKQATGIYYLGDLTSEQKAIIEDLENQIIKIDLTNVYVGLGLDTPYAWLLRNGIKLITDTNNQTSTAYEFICYSNDMKMGNELKELGVLSFYYFYDAKGTLTSFNKCILYELGKINLESVSYRTHDEEISGVKNFLSGKLKAHNIIKGEYTLALPNKNGTIATTDDIHEYVAGNGIHINGYVISADAATYSAGSGLNLNGTQFSVDTSVIATNTYVENYVNNKIVGAYIYKGSVSSYANLPTNITTSGFVYNVSDTGMNYASIYSGGVLTWDALGQTFTPYIAGRNITITNNTINASVPNVIVSSLTGTLTQEQINTLKENGGILIYSVTSGSGMHSTTTDKTFKKYSTTDYVGSGTMKFVSIDLDSSGNVEWECSIDLATKGYTITNATIHDSTKQDVLNVGSGLSLNGSTLTNTICQYESYTLED